MKRLSFNTLFICSLILVINESLSAEELDAPSLFRIKSISEVGDDCREGHMTLTKSPDNQALTALFDDFTLEFKAGDPKAQRKQCRFKFDTEQDPGWEFAIIAVTARGYASLDAGMVGRQVVSYGTAPNAQREKTVLTLRGPFNDDYINAAQVPQNEVTYSGCKTIQGLNRTKDFVIGAGITLRAEKNDSPNGMLTVDSLDGKFSLNYDVIWRRCGGVSRKSVVICQISATDDSARSLLAKGVGKDPNSALAKARSNLAERCANSAAHDLCSHAEVTCKEIKF